ncbi:cell envelope integrity protein CreD [Vibrio hippocampi]|uniref:Inner membrane protein CreD n=1 Tax=Vibrio hippocampi TaxID=654686 RepID=A0ABM8ZM86_9VIBR|nr:cell envelope integrity protein CreD [Vibrio hippocampi]CAH0529375.1 Inner membrane protein CreD [Vibrio hippocampi]
MKNILNNQLGMKFAFVLFLFVLLQVPLSMVSELISERSYRQDEVRNDIARSSSGEQRIIGPFIMVNYTETSYLDDELQIKERRKFLLPSTFDMSAHLDSFEKYRGIYRARLYKAQVALKGAFDADDLASLQDVDIDSISLVVGIKDSRGLIRLDDMVFASSDIEVMPGTGLEQLPQGFHSPLKLTDLNKEQPLTFDINFLLQGLGQLQVTPIGGQTTVELSSAWAHPSFIGDYLPVSSDISEDGFKAQWVSNNFSTNINQLFQSCLSSNNVCRKLEQRQMGVDLIDPVDHYLKSHRAVNYSLLVITLVFASFFLLELFQARPVHPVQYGFIGLALALFYLLLISMSEHLGFNWAYVVSAVASTSLLSVYVSGMLNNVKHGAIFGACLLTLYGLLFGLLQAENYALVMGALLCFAILSFTMVITRNVDWYAYARDLKTEETIKVTHEDA